eukprot:1329263-Amorphochlora_amoeboformis.AAC.1
MPKNLSVSNFHKIELFGSHNHQVPSVMTALSLLFVALTTSQASRRVELSAGFTSNMVLQRSSKNGPFIYGFASDIDGEIPEIFAEVEGVGGGGEKVKYTKKVREELGSPVRV